LARFEALSASNRANFDLSWGMTLRDVVVRRRMVRAFTTEPVERQVVDGLLDLARRAPSAGNSQGTAFVVLDTPDAVAGYWDLTLPPDRRATFGWPGLLDAPVLVVVVCSAGTYVDRYAEPDKVATGLGDDAEDWSVPYWFVDAGMAVEHLLLGVTEAGLGACFFSLFDHEAAVLGALGVPAGWRAVGTVALGHPAPDRQGTSAGRPRRPLDEVVHRTRW
jgi:nitroreductase